MPPDSTKPSASSAPGLPSRQWLAIAALAAAVLVSVGLGLWSFERRAHEYLREELGQHLQDLAVSVAATTPGDSLAFWLLLAEEGEGGGAHERRLFRIRQDNDLANIFVCLPGGEVVLDTSRSLLPGELHPFLVLDMGEVESARSGIATHSRLYHSLRDRYFMTGYAPIFDDSGLVAGFVGVEASVGYFDALGALRGSLLVIGGTVVALVALLMVLWVGYARRLARARWALTRQETLSAMGRMAAGIAHEIRNPLGIIKNTAQLLAEDLREQGVEAEMLRYIPEEVDRRNESLTGYLEFAREAPPRMAPVELDKLLRRTLKLLEPDFSAAGVTVEESLTGGTDAVIQADARRLQQVFLNLLLNALQAMPSGGQLELDLQCDADRVTVRVRDTGVGLQPGDAEQLFEPFVTSKERGSGLGLSVARRIVEEQHGGRLRLSGRPGEGALATVELPRRKA
jgi:signal transduction histidine kinase